MNTVTLFIIIFILVALLMWLTIMLIDTRLMCRAMAGAIKELYALSEHSAIIHNSTLKQCILIFKKLGITEFDSHDIDTMVKDLIEANNELKKHSEDHRTKR